MKEYFRELNDVLNAYTFGDLFEAMQAVELCDQLITENKMTEAETVQIRNLKTLLESIILQGDSDDRQAALEQMKAALLHSAASVECQLQPDDSCSQKEATSVTADDLLSQMGGAAEDSSSFDNLLSQMTDKPETHNTQADIDTLLSQMSGSSADQSSAETEQSSSQQEQPQSVIITVDDGETLNSFVSESMEHLDSVEALIINLEETHDHDTVNAIFRAMHTIKGVSGFMGFSQITQLSHKLENLLDALRSNEIIFSAELIDILLAGSDMLRAMMNVLAPIAAEYAASEDSFNVEFPVYNIAPILNDVDKYMSGHSASDSGSSEQTTSGNNFSDKKSTQEPQPAASTEIPASSFSAPQLTPSELGEYAYAAKKIFQNLKQSLLKLQEDIHNQAALNEILTETDTLNKASSKLGIQEISDLCGLISNKIKRAEGGYALSYSDLFSGLKTLADAFKARMILLKQTAGIAVSPDENEIEKKAADEASTPLPDASAGTEPVRKPAEDTIPGFTENQPVPQTAVASSTPVDKRIDSKPQHTVAAGQSPAADPEATTVRVDVKKMDKLFNMIGELITAQDILLEQFRTDEESQEIQKAKSHLEKVTREIQELSMQLRMVTLNALFNKMKRVARDLSRKLNKEVNFNIFGQDTEMDRNVIDEISDPLMHIIRNALDHGIEDAATRQAAGKSAIGNVTLGAEYEGNGIVISVRDDGGGLNKEKILAKAIQNGIVSEEAAASMPERKIFDLVMLPGFSTSEKVSDISGRGVGMDVVKRSIDALRGSINILSEEGKGSEFRIRIPLTLAIIDAIAFKIGNLTFATQITDVVEFYKAKQEQITTTQSQGQVLNLRGELIPILEMSSYFNLEHQYVSYEDGIVIVASSNNKKVAIVVDEIIGNKHLVIKPLPTVFAHISSLSGCSILAGGDTCLIVDMNRLLGEILDLT